MERVIFHVDMDAFFASVEQLDHPEYRGQPVIIGGVSERGVVSTCSYEARVFGVHSAMSSVMARKLCPNGIFLRGNMHRYSECSQQVFEVLRQFTDRIEPVSIDEAYLDFTGTSQDPVQLAWQIKDRIKEETGLTISVGISSNKFLAKLASDWLKPDGLKWIREEEAEELLASLPVSRVHGIGKKTVEKLNRIGIHTVADLRRLKRGEMALFFGKSGSSFYDRIRGIDHRELNFDHQRKSIGHERTFETSVKTKGEALSYLKYFSYRLEQDLKAKGLSAKTITVKIKYDDFQVTTKRMTFEHPVQREEHFYEACIYLVEKISFRSSIRLIGLSAENLAPFTGEQLTLL